MKSFRLRLPCRRALVLLACCGLSFQGHAEEPYDCVIEPHLLVDISSSEVGVLGEVNVDTADIVEKGQTLAALRTEVEQAALELSRFRAAARGEIELMRRTHELSERNRARNVALHRQRAVSAQKLDEIRTEADVARLRLRQVEEKNELARLEAARDARVLARRSVLSPFAGVVVKRFKSAGEYVEGDPIVQLAQIDPLRVELVAPIAMYGRILVGGTATVVPELPIEGNFIATVTRVDPVLDAATATFGVRLSLPNPELRLPPGLKCTLSLHHPPSGGATASAPPLVDRKRDGPAAPTDFALAPPVVGAAEQSLAVAVRTPAPRTSAPVANATGDATHDTPPDTPDESPNENWGENQDEARGEALPAAPGPAALHLGALHLGAGACFALGPFRESRELKRVASRLRIGGVSFTRRETRREGPTIHVVISPRVETRSDSILRGLAKANVPDYQLIKQGQWAGRVSYGRFSVEKYALARASVMRGLGFKASVLSVTATVPEYWLEFSPRMSQGSPPRRGRGATQG